MEPTNRPPPGARWPAEDTARWPGLTSRYAWLAPHEDETRTGRGQIGVAFSAHRDVTYASGGRRSTVSYPGGSVICSGDSPIVWSAVRDHTEALEIYPDPELVASTAGRAPEASGGWLVARSVVGRADPVVLAVASRLRRAHVGGGYLGDTAASTLAHLLARHVLTEYAGVHVERVPGHTRLSGASLRRVHDLVEAELDGMLTLDRLASQAHLSAFHFARAFKASVGIAPHAFVTSRRMDRARLLLLTTSRPVERVATQVGFVNVSHFRRVFRAHAGCSPSWLRARASYA